MPSISCAIVIIYCLHTFSTWEFLFTIWMFCVYAEVMLYDIYNCKWKYEPLTKVFDIFTGGGHSHSHDHHDHSEHSYSHSHSHSHSLEDLSIGLSVLCKFLLDSYCVIYNLYFIKAVCTCVLRFILTMKIRNFSC